MRLLTILTMAAAIGAAGAANAQSANSMGGMRIPDQPNAGFNTATFASRQAAIENAKRIRLAKEAATLINAGRCPEALQLAKDADDTALGTRIVQVCNAPAKQAAR